MDIFLFLFPIIISSVSAQDPVVSYENGSIVGTKKVTSTQFPYFSYEGIRYALPPIGNQRFKDSKPAGALQGRYDARQPGSQCLQPNGNADPVGSEDCLFLNVYVPNIAPNTSIPVIVYIHGGAFSSGLSTFRSPHLFIEKKKIFISIEYRLGPLGFLCLNTPEVPGNAALKDQALALKWIKKYIIYFGGDPNNISIFGDSAGAVAVQLQQISPMARGLMNKVMSISGASLCEAAIQRNPLGKASQLAFLLGLNSTRADFLQNLQAKSGADIVRASQSVQIDRVYGIIQEYVFSPVIERVYPGVQAFIDKEPVEYYRTGNYTHVPIMIGQTSLEFASTYLAYGPDIIQQVLQSYPLVVIPNSWQAVLSPNGIQTVFNLIRNFFFGTTTINLSNHDQLESAVNLLGDIFILLGTNKVVRELVKTSRAPIYYYEFSFLGYFNSYIQSVGMIGASHTDEMLYLCPDETPRAGEYIPDGVIRKRLMTLYDNMLLSGNPTPGPYSNVLPTKWLPVTNVTLNYMAISNGLIPSYSPNEVRMNFWMDTENRVFRGDFK